MKSQGSAASNRKTLQSQIRQSAQNRLSINALDIVHGQLLSDRKYNIENRAVRAEVLRDFAPALTVIIAGIFDEAWLLEIEVVAAA